MLQASSSYQSSAGSEGVGIVGTVIILAFALVMIASMWKLFEKAGEPGWACIVPIYGMVVMLRIAGKPWWWIILMIIPFVSIIFYILWALALAKSFGKGGGFGVGIALLGFIFIPILAFGDARYTGPQA